MTDQTRSNARKPSPVLQPYTKYGGMRQKVKSSIIILLFAFFCLPFGFYFALTVPYLLQFFLIPLGIMIALTIWALPDLNKAPTGLLTPLIYFFSAALLLWPNYLAIALPGLPWITMIRLTTFPMTIVLLICVSVSAAFRADVSRSISATPVVWKTLVLFVGAQLFSLPFSKNPADSFNALLVAQTSWIAVFFVSAYVFTKPGRMGRWAAGLWVMALVVGTMALLENRHHQVLWAGHIPSFLRVGDEVVQRILAGSHRTATGQYRIQGTFSTPLGLAEFCALALPFIIHFAMMPNKLIVRLLAAASIPYIWMVILGTDGRLGLLGLFLSIMVYAFLWGMRRWKFTDGSLMGPATVMAYPIILIAAIISTFVVGRIRNRVWGSGQYAASNEARLDQLSMGVPKVLTHPFGHGIGMGGDGLGFTNSAGIQTIDNYLLLIALDIGIVGLILYFVLLGAPIYYAIKYSFSQPGREGENTFLVPLAISLVNFAAIKIFFSNDDNHPLMFMMMGMVAALVYRIRTVVEPGFATAGPRKIFQFRQPLLARRSI